MIFVKISDAEKLTAEKVKEIERLLLRIDTLEGANERFLQSKERQDNDMAMLQQRNQQLVSRVMAQSSDIFPCSITMNWYRLI